MNTWISIPTQTEVFDFWQHPEFATPGVTLLLWKGLAQLTDARGEIHNIEPALLWEDSHLILCWNQESTITLGDGQLEADGLEFEGVFVNSSSGRAIVLNIRNTVVRNVHSLEFALTNAKNFTGGQCVVGDYVVTLVQTLAPRDAPTILTHLLRIYRQDGAEFNPTDPTCESLNWALTLALTFASGGIVTLVLERGFDAGGALIWRNYQASRVIRRAPLDFNWLSMQSHFVWKSFEEVLQGFYRLTLDPHWRDSLGLAVDFYGNAHADELVGAAKLILLQAGLEKLVSTWDETPNARALPKALNTGLGARLGRMLAWAKIPTDVPTQLSDLVVLVRDAPNGTLQPPDGPTAMAFVRNKMGHSVSPNLRVTLTPHHEIEAYRLASRYLELLLLRLAQAQSPVVNPLVTGRSAAEVEPLPWI